MLWLILGQLPSEYLGIEVGKLAVFEGGWVYQDQYQTKQVSVVDTDRVVSSFDYNGNLAFEIYSVEVGTGDSNYTDASTDTVWNDPPFLMAKVYIGPNSKTDASVYKTPFTVGDKWSLGTEGWYYDDFDGDGQPDSLIVRADTMEVVAEETITVPAGTFQCFKLKETLYAVETKSSYGFMIDSVVISAWAYYWWSPGNYLVKDTVHQDVTVYMFGTPYPGTYDAHYELTALTDVKEAPAESAPKLLTPVAKGVLTLQLPEGSPLVAVIYDPAGRKLGFWKVKGPVAQIPVSHLPKGLYVISVGNLRAKFIKE